MKNLGLVKLKVFEMKLNLGRIEWEEDLQQVSVESPPDFLNLWKGQLAKKWLGDQESNLGS